jgi:hypothetical protein
MSRTRNPPPTLPNDYTKKDENLLRTIGGLSLILASPEGTWGEESKWGKGWKWGKEGQPIVSTFSKAIQQLASNRDVPSHGQSNSTLNNVIHDAVKTFLDE